MNPEAGSSPERTDLIKEQFPTPEDWIALQGGKPRVFRNPGNPSAAWIVLHVYDEHDDARLRFKNGFVYQTIPPEEHFRIGSFDVQWNGENGIVRRTVRAPYLMINRYHGDPCTQQSLSAGSQEGYRRIGNQTSYSSFINELEQRGMQEVRFGMTKTGYAFSPLPKIRKPRPCDVDYEQTN